MGAERPRPGRPRPAASPDPSGRSSLSASGRHQDVPRCGRRWEASRSRRTGASRDTGIVLAECPTHMRIRQPNQRNHRAAATFMLHSVVLAAGATLAGCTAPDDDVDYGEVESYATV